MILLSRNKQFKIPSRYFVGLFDNDTTRFDQFVGVDTICHLWNNGFQNEVTIFSEDEQEALFEGAIGFWNNYYDRPRTCFLSQ